MNVTGKYKYDEKTDTITIYANNTMYSIYDYFKPHGELKVGEEMVKGVIFTQSMYDLYSSLCTKEGTFMLKERR